MTSDRLPDFKPLMLTGLSYSEAIHQARETGCSLRRLHWCNPVLVIGPRGGRVLDDEGERKQYVPTIGDMNAIDWMVVEPSQ